MTNNIAKKIVLVYYEAVVLEKMYKISSSSNKMLFLKSLCFLKILVQENNVELFKNWDILMDVSIIYKSFLILILLKSPSNLRKRTLVEFMEGIGLCD